MGVLLAAMAFAQEDAIEASFQKLSAEEERRLRAILAEPLVPGQPRRDLERQVREKSFAARRMSDAAEEERVLREALPLVPQSWVRNDLAVLLRGRDVQQAISLHQEVVDGAGYLYKPFYMGNLAYDYFLAFDNPQTLAVLDKGLALLQQGLDKENRVLRRRELLRGGYRLNNVLSLLEERRGNWLKSIDAAQHSLDFAHQAYTIPAPGDQPKTQQYLAEDVAGAWARKTQAQRAAGRFADAEVTLQGYVGFAAKAALPASYRAGIYHVAATLRFAQRDFARSEQLARKSDAILEELGKDELSSDRLSRRNGIMIALAGQNKWREALAEIERLDRLAQGNEAAQRRVLMRYERGWIYLGNQLYSQAEPLFERAARGNLQLYGAGHYFVAQAQGLQGVCLWRMGGIDNRRKGLVLLQKAVADLISPHNVDYLDQFGIRPDVRQLIVSAYIEAAAQSDKDLVLEALGLADWLRAGAVQEAMADAAVRMAAGTQGLAELVRQEQDAKHEVRGLRTYLEAQGGTARPLSSDAEARMRERVAQLEQLRTRLQALIRSGFPEYERLVRPLPPRIEEVGARLGGDEALLVVMPDAQGVNLWAVRQEAGRTQARFHRAPVPYGQLSTWVTGLRRGLESYAYGQVQPFDDALAYQVYQALLEPLAAELAPRRNWIVAASGPLAALPLAVLQNRRPGGDGQPAWLIREVSLTQVPSVASWLSVRGLDRRQLPGQALLAWGDPVFDGARVVAKGAKIRNLVVARVEAPQVDAAPAMPMASPSVYGGIPALPDTREELLEISRALGADAVHDLLLGAQATRASVLRANASGALAQKKVLVFATHGLKAGDLPGLTQPALALAADGSELRNPQGPLLLLEDVLGLKLNADWVVLSACNTAASDGRAEEALSGLARGFLYAGGRSLLVTHWAVESESARQLTTRTFEHFMREPQSSRAENLRHAMLEVMAMPQYGHPAFWAPYALVGEARR